MRDLHLSFKNLKKQAIRVVAGTLDDEYLMAGTLASCVERLQKLYDKLQQIYDLPAARLELIPASPSGPLSAINLTEDGEVTVLLAIPSVAEVLHQVRHLMQMRGIIHYAQSPEYDAYGWAYSLMWQASRDTVIYLARVGALPYLLPLYLEPLIDERVHLSDQEQDALDEISKSLMCDMPEDDELAQAIREFEAGEG